MTSLKWHHKTWFTKQFSLKKYSSSVAIIDEDFALASLQASQRFCIAKSKLTWKSSLSLKTKHHWKLNRHLQLEDPQFL